MATSSYYGDEDDDRDIYSDIEDGYDDDQDLDDEDNEAEDDEDNEAEDDEDNEDEDDEGLDEEMAQQKLTLGKQLSVAEEQLKVLKAKLERTITPSDPLILTPRENAIYKKAKGLSKDKLCIMLHPFKVKHLRQELSKIDILIKKLKYRYWSDKISKILQAASPILPFILLGALIIFLIIAISAWMASMFPFLFGDKDAPVNAVYGIKGDKFYGVRLLYTDEDKARAGIVENYSKIVEKSVAEIVETKTITGSDSQNYQIEITMPTLILPNEEYDYSSFDEAQFSTDYTELYNVVTAIASEVYSGDNPGETVPATLSSRADGIKYFGFDETLNPTIKELVADYIKTHYQFACPTDAEGVITTDAVNTMIDEKVGAIFDNVAYKVRTQKLFIKDHILTDADDYVKDIKTENYVAMIYMPKEDVTFTDFNYNITYVDLSTFSVLLKVGDDGITLNNDLDAAIKVSDTEYSYRYHTDEECLVRATTFTAIDTNNLSALQNGMSLINLVQNSELDYSIYLEQVEIESKLVYTFKDQGVSLVFESDRPFICVEYETKYN